MISRHGYQHKKNIEKLPVVQMLESINHEDSESSAGTRMERVSMFIP